MLPQTWGHVSSVLPQKLGETILATVHPNHVAPTVLAPIDLVLAVGEMPESTLRKFAGAPCRAERIRHRRKYAEGNLRYHSFYFRGPNGRLNLRAQNLAIFSQIAEGLDEPTWMFHLRRNDYSRWFREAIRDKYLAQQAERIELRTDLSWPQSRHLIRELIGTRYTLPE